jgi:hypothetical protein
MNDLQIQARKASGKEIAARYKIVRNGDVWIVPASKSVRRHYEVNLDPTNSSCTCPDHAETGQKCKHIYAVEHMLRGQPNPAEPRTITDQPKRPTYRREWRPYNEAQTNEEREFEPLLFNLCQTIPRTEHRRGRPPVPIRDAVFAAVSKVFLTKSARRVIPRLDLAYERARRLSSEGASM